MEISIVKTKIMACEGKGPIRGKNCIYNQVTEQVNCFSNLVIMLHTKMKGTSVIWKFKLQQHIGSKESSIHTKFVPDAYSDWSLQEFIAWPMST
jgi:hypothetical protein